MPFPSGFTDLTNELQQASFVFGELGFRSITGGEAFGNAMVSGYQSSFFTSWDLALVGFVIGSAAAPDNPQPSRIASSFNETAGDIITGVPQNDVAAQETMPKSEQWNVGDRLAYRTITRPERTIKNFMVSAELPQQGAKRTYRYRTVKSLMDNLFPASIVMHTEQAGLGPEATAQQVVQFVLNRWQTEYLVPGGDQESPPLLRFRAVPPLYLYTPDEDGEYTYQPTTAAIYLPQPENNRKSMSQYLEELLRVFVGYKLVLDSEDYLVIRSPEWSPDYDRETYELDPMEVIAPFPEPVIDDSNVRNRYTVMSKEIGFSEDQQLIAPHFLRFGNYLGEEATPDPQEYQELANVSGPPGSLNWANASGTITIQDGGENPVPILIGGDSVTITGMIDAFFSFSESSGANSAPSTWSYPNPVPFELVVPVGGMMQQTFLLSNWSSAPIALHWITHRVTIAARFLPEEGGASRVQISASRTIATPGSIISGVYYVAIVVRVDSMLGDAYGETGQSFSGTWGQTDDHLSDLPGLGLSQLIYGIREGELQAAFFTLDNEQCMALARSLCRWYMNPRARYNNVQLTVASDVGPDDIWRRFRLPVDAVAIMENYTYSDARTFQRLMARTAIALETLYDLTSGMSEPAAAFEDDALGIDGMSFYTN